MEVSNSDIDFVNVCSFVGIETCLELAVPFTKYFNGRLRLKIKFDKYPDYVVETEKEIYIEHDSLITFVETDKPVYKPGQDVNIRILMLKHDLKPWKKTVHRLLSINIKINISATDYFNCVCVRANVWVCVCVL